MAEQKTIWLCSHCGYHPESSGRWCGAGCGSDYNRMVKVEGLAAVEIVELFDKLIAVREALGYLPRVRLE